MSELKAHTDVKMGSERSFGLVFAFVFAVIALWPVFKGNDLRIWASVISVAFAVVSLVYPAVLKPLNRLWFRFGILLSKIVSPIVMGLIFVLTVIPIGLIRRMRHPDPLNQKIDPDAETYWVRRNTEESEPTSMRKQF